MRISIYSPEGQHIGFIERDLSCPTLGYHGGIPSEPFCHCYNAQGDKVGYGRPIWTRSKNELDMESCREFWHRINGTPLYDNSEYAWLAYKDELILESIAGEQWTIEEFHFIEEFCEYIAVLKAADDYCRFSSERQATQTFYPLLSKWGLRIVKRR